MTSQECAEAQRRTVSHDGFALKQRCERSDFHKTQR